MFRCVYFLLLIPVSVFSQADKKVNQVEVLVIGGGVGGTAAGIQAARLGAKTVIAESTTMLGGMLTAAGVSCTDGNDQLPSGMWEAFRQALYKHYGKKRLNTGWVSNTNFEPRVADSIFKAWAAAEKNLQVYFEYEFETVLKKGNKITGATFRNKKNGETLTIKAAVVVDATELGDVFAKAGAAYDLGMDDPAASGEKEARQKNNIIQDLTWAAVLKDYGPGADKTIAKPEGYDAKKYYCTCTDAPCDGKPWNGDKLKMLNYGKLPRSPGATQDKYMLNWPPFGNDIYLNVVDSNYEIRFKNYELAKQHTLGFIYFMQTELGMKNIGLADDELNNGMALIPYNREGRRVKGVVRMNINHIKQPYDYTLYRTGISVGDYPVDHHHARYPGNVPELEFPHIPAYNIPMGALIPETMDGLIVCEKGISVTNIVNGTTRLQPVVLLTGQAAGVLAAKFALLPKQKRVNTGRMSVRWVQESLLKAKCYLMPFTDLKPDHEHWVAIQKAGVTGILKGTGKAEGWANKTYFHPDSTISIGTLDNNFSELIIGYSKSSEDESVLTIEKAFTLLEKAHFAIIKNYKKYPGPISNVFSDKQYERVWMNLNLKDYHPQRAIKKYELAALADPLLDIFSICYVDINGK